MLERKIPIKGLCAMSLGVLGVSVGLIILFMEFLGDFFNKFLGFLEFSKSLDLNFCCFLVWICTVFMMFREMRDI